MLPTNILFLGSCFRFLQNRDDLFFPESLPLHPESHSPFYRKTHHSKRTLFRGKGHWLAQRSGFATIRHSAVFQELLRCETVLQCDSIGDTVMQCLIGYAHVSTEDLDTAA